MLQYLINTTAIWLVSLVLFDLFLRKETYHNYNRVYLLVTFLLGLFLPVIQWQENSTIYHTAMERPLLPIITAKQNIVAATPHTAASASWQKWFIIIYAVGAIAALCVLLADTVKLVVLYRTGKKQKKNGWLVIETGRGHAPFSFLNMLFINSRQQYTDEEWRIILVHEQRHKKLLHFADLLLMQLGRIIFWFHPLVYIYNKRLLMVHEYQADNAAATQPQAYGSFLIEQALLGDAPTLSHSFNRSPIKKRIVMLTHRSPNVAKSKLLVFIPLLLVCMFCFTQNSFSNKPQKHGNIAKYKGNTIEFLAPEKPDSYMERDETTGKLHRVPINWPEPPILVNGQKIYDPYKDKNVINPTMKKGYKNLLGYIMQNIQKECEALDDGDYFLLILDVVIDAKGKVVYFDDKGIFRIGGGMDKQLKQQQLIERKMDELMDNAPQYEPAKVNDMPVAFFMNSVAVFSYGYNSEADLKVKDHKITWDITKQ